MLTKRFAGVSSSWLTFLSVGRRRLHPKSPFIFPPLLPKKLRHPCPLSSYPRRHDQCRRLAVLLDGVPSYLSHLPNSNYLVSPRPRMATSKPQQRNKSHRVLHSLLPSRRLVNRKAGHQRVTRPATFRKLSPVV